MRSTSFANESIDYIYANAVLEHVPWDVLQDILNECHRLLTPNGIMAFEIDYRDHAWDRRCGRPPYHAESPYHFLQFSNEEWSQYIPCDGHHNRKRHKDYEKLFLDYDFTIIVNTPVSPFDSSFTHAYQLAHDLPPADYLIQSLSNLTITEKFKTYKLEELAVLTGFWVLKKNIIKKLNTNTK
jgi:SAM-dependent methyltransferase